MEQKSKSSSNNSGEGFEVITTLSPTTMAAAAAAAEAEGSTSYFSAVEDTTVTTMSPGALARAMDDEEDVVSSLEVASPPDDTVRGDTGQHIKGLTSPTSGDVIITPAPVQVESGVTNSFGPSTPEAAAAFTLVTEMSLMTSSTPLGVTTVRKKLRPDSPAVFPNEPLSTSTEETNEMVSPPTASPDMHDEKEQEGSTLRNRVGSYYVAGEEGEAEPLIPTPAPAEQVTYPSRRPRGRRPGNNLLEDSVTAPGGCWCFGCIHLLIQWVCQRLGFTRRSSRQD